MVTKLFRSFLILTIFTSQTGFSVTVTPKIYKPAKAKKPAYSPFNLSGRFASWGINPQYKDGSINLLGAWKNFEKKSEVVVAVVDTGIQYNHPFLANNLITMKGALGPKNFGVDFSKTSKLTTPNDTHGHGTHISGIIKSIFPEVKILSLKFFNPHATGAQSVKSTIQALQYAVDQNVDIINYSGGGAKASAQERAILEKAKRKGILVIAAAGNEGSNIDLKKNAYFPASYGFSNIISVAAHNEKNKLITASNWGSKTVDIAAPGYRIRSAFPNNASGILTGTSQATAFVTGVAALIKANYPRLTSTQIRNIIISSSKKIKGLKNKVLGSGKLDASQALAIAKNVHNKIYAQGRKIAQSTKK